MVRGPRRHLGPLVTKRVKVLPKVLDERRGKFVDRYAARIRLVDNAIVYVSEIKDMLYLITLEPQITSENIAKDKGSKVADMSKVPYGRAADVHPHPPVFERLKFLYLTRQRIKESEHKQLSAIKL